MDFEKFGGHVQNFPDYTHKNLSFKMNSKKFSKRNQLEKILKCVELKELYMRQEEVYALIKCIHLKNFERILKFCASKINSQNPQ